MLLTCVEITLSSNTVKSNTVDWRLSGLNCGSTNLVYKIFNIQYFSIERRMKNMSILNIHFSYPKHILMLAFGLDLLMKITVAVWATCDTFFMSVQEYYSSVILRTQLAEYISCDRFIYHIKCYWYLIVANFVWFGMKYEIAMDRLVRDYISQIIKLKCMITIVEHNWTQSVSWKFWNSRLLYHFV